MVTPRVLSFPAVAHFVDVSGPKVPPLPRFEHVHDMQSRLSLGRAAQLHIEFDGLPPGRTEFERRTIRWAGDY